MTARLQVQRDESPLPASDVDPELFNGFSFDDEGGVSHCAVCPPSSPYPRQLQIVILLGTKMPLIRIHVRILNISLSLLMIYHLFISLMWIGMVLLPCQQHNRYCRLPPRRRRHPLSLVLLYLPHPLLQPLIQNQIWEWHLQMQCSNLALGMSWWMQPFKITPRAIVTVAFTVETLIYIHVTSKHGKRCYQAENGELRRASP